MPTLTVDEQYLEYELKRLQAKLSHMQSAEVGRAQAAALNKAAAIVRTGTVRKTSASLSIQQKLLRARIRISRASSRKLEAGVRVNARGIPMIKLGAKEVPGGVQAGPYLMPDAFISTTKNTPKQRDKNRKTPAAALVGRTQVFKRKGKKRYPLVAVNVEIRKQIRTDAINTAGAAMRRDIQRLLKHEYEFRIMKRMPK